MAISKYAEDYRMEDTVHPRTGKTVTRAVYCGKRFVFALEGEALSAVKRTYLIFCAILLLAFLPVLSLNAPCGHEWYVMIPFVLQLWPAFYLAMGVWQVYRTGEWMTRSTRDRLGTRLNACPCFLIGLGALSLVGHVVYLFKHGYTALDVISLVCTLVIFGCSCGIFAMRKKTRIVEKKQDGSSPNDKDA